MVKLDFVLKVSRAEMKALAKTVMPAGILGALPSSFRVLAASCSLWCKTRVSVFSWLRADPRQDHSRGFLGRQEGLPVPQVLLCPQAVMSLCSCLISWKHSSDSVPPGIISLDQLEVNWSGTVIPSTKPLVPFNSIVKEGHLSLFTGPACTPERGSRGQWESCSYRK